jgi:hypothetical protein
LRDVTDPALTWAYRKVIAGIGLAFCALAFDADGENRARIAVIA